MNAPVVPQNGRTAFDSDRQRFLEALRRMLLNPTIPAAEKRQEVDATLAAVRQVARLEEAASAR